MLIRYRCQLGCQDLVQHLGDQEKYNDRQEPDRLGSLQLGQ